MNNSMTVYDGINGWSVFLVFFAVLVLLPVVIGFILDMFKKKVNKKLGIAAIALTIFIAGVFIFQKISVNIFWQNRASEIARMTTQQKVKQVALDEFSDNARIFARKFNYNEQSWMTYIVPKPESSYLRDGAEALGNHEVSEDTEQTKKDIDYYSKETGRKNLVVLWDYKGKRPVYASIEGQNMTKWVKDNVDFTKS
ncbi:hypothetical protein [Lentilactobacillus sp. Marseille-Q4993]|uniref:hypothetical protein n=1 Tax=Lentilactobacillus sp. Marseille-Q4993 TaxID=3039492 RepID=UPI0024BD4213|nr:hypothetical protein [Lentilactobacillus sp. Marseille-Q4993]